MANSKHQKPTVRKHDGFTKAGPKSRSGGKNRGSGKKIADLLSPSATSSTAGVRSDAETKQAQFEFRLEQAELARHLLTLQMGSLADRMARLVLTEFPGVIFDEKTTSRTKAAIVAARGQLSGSELQREAAIRLGANVANAVLIRAYNELTDVGRGSGFSSVTPQLANA